MCNSKRSGQVDVCPPRNRNIKMFSAEAIHKRERRLRDTYSQHCVQTANKSIDTLKCMRYEQNIQISKRILSVRNNNKCDTVFKCESLFHRYRIDYDRQDQNAYYLCRKGGKIAGKSVQVLHPRVTQQVSWIFPPLGNGCPTGNRYGLLRFKLNEGACASRKWNKVVYSAVGDKVIEIGPTPLRNTDGYALSLSVQTQSICGSRPRSVNRPTTSVLVGRSATCKQRLCLYPPSRTKPGSAFGVRGSMAACHAYLLTDKPP